MFFGWAWRTDRDKSDLAWKHMNIPLPDLDDEIRKAEDAGLGGFTRDDVRVSFEGLALQVQFCHHGGIHLQYPEPGEITRHFLDRWRGEGLDPWVFERPDGVSDWREVSGGET